MIVFSQVFYQRINFYFKVEIKGDVTSFANVIGNSSDKIMWNLIKRSPGGYSQNLSIYFVLYLKYMYMFMF